MPQRLIKLQSLHPYDNPQKRLGRLPALDFRDKQFMRRGIPVLKTIERKWKYYWAPPITDQGNTSECTAFGGDNLLSAGPVVNLKPRPWGTGDEGRHALYKLNQQNDEWPGEDYEGSSVRAVMKVFQMNKLITKYEWANSAEMFLAYMLMNGGNVGLLGTDWYNSMFNTKKFNGHSWIVVRKDSGLAGGHCYLSLGGSRILRCPHDKSGAIQMQQTWGDSWGDNGRAFMCLHDLDDLIKAYGEAALCDELKFAEVKAHKGLPTNEPVDFREAAGVDAPA